MMWPLQALHIHPTVFTKHWISYGGFKAPDIPILCHFCLSARKLSCLITCSCLRLSQKCVTLTHYKKTTTDIRLDHTCYACIIWDSQYSPVLAKIYKISLGKWHWMCEIMVTKGDFPSLFCFSLVHRLTWPTNTGGYPHWQALQPNEHAKLKIKKDPGKT